MTITIAPYTVNPDCDCKISTVWSEKEEHIKENHLPITYWGIYFDDKHVSSVSSRELAEKTKLWMERWLESRF
jgi:hypothetical protein